HRVSSVKGNLPIRSYLNSLVSLSKITEVKRKVNHIRPRVITSSIYHCSSCKWKRRCIFNFCNVVQLRVRFSYLEILRSKHHRFICTSHYDVGGNNMRTPWGLCIKV